MKTITLGAMCAGILFCTAFSVSHAAPIPGQGTWETTLQGRDLNGDSIFDAYYDTVLGISWLADANHTDTTMTWYDATAWAAGLNIHGTTGWRLPDTGPVNGSSYNYSLTYDGSTDIGYNISAPGTDYEDSVGSELAHLFYNTLGNEGICNPATSTFSSCGSPQAGWGLSNTGPFSNIQPYGYWSGTDYTPSAGEAWYFYFSIGNQDSYGKPLDLFAWAVHAGDVGVSEVPAPAAVWLLVSGLFGLVVTGRMRR